MFRRAAPAAAAPAATAPAAEAAEADAGPRIAIVALADLLPREGVGSEAFYVASDAFGESLLACGAALLELSAEDELILEGALLAARAFFDGPAAGKTPHAAPASGGEGWHTDAKTGDEELWCRMNGHAALLPPVVAPWAERATAVLGAAARASLGALSRAPVLGLRPGAGGLGRLLQDAPLPRGARGASLLVASRLRAEPQAAPACATHLGLLTLLALQPGAALELQPPPGAGAPPPPVRVATPPGLVAVLAGETLHYATAGGVRPVPYRVVAAAAGAHPPPLALALRVHGEPAAALPAGSGIFSACGDVAAFERLRLSPPPPAPPPAAAKAVPPAAGGGAAAVAGGVSNVTGATVHITADTISISSTGGTSMVAAGGMTATGGGGGGGFAGGASGGGGGNGWGLASGGKAPAASPAEPQLRLSVQDAAGGELRFLVPLSAPLHTVFDVYCAKRGVPAAAARFLAPSGGRAALNPASTVREAGLRDGDILVLDRTDAARMCARLRSPWLEEQTADEEEGAGYVKPAASMGATPRGVTLGRPDVAAMVVAAVARAAALDAPPSRVAVFACGPESLTRAAHLAAAAMGCHVHLESFNA